MATGDKCPRCNGTGRIRGGLSGDGVPPTQCPTCRGTGRQQKPRCKKCLGYGVVNTSSGAQKCNHCNGTGDEP